MHYFYIYAQTYDFYPDYVILRQHCNFDFDSFLKINSYGKQILQLTKHLIHYSISERQTNFAYISLRMDDNDKYNLKGKSIGEIMYTINNN